MFLMMFEILTVIALVLMISQSESEMADLSHGYVNGMLYYSAWEKPWKMEIVHRGIYKKKYWAEWNDISTVEHGGTHMDAPVHIHQMIGGEIDPTKWKVDQIPFERLRGPGVVFDAREKSEAQENYELSVQDIHDYEEKYGRIPNGAVTFMMTGWDRYYKEQNKEKYYGKDEHVSPGFGPEAIKWLIDNRAIVGMGTDAGSIGAGIELEHWMNDNDEYVGTHPTTLSRNVWGIENLANLDQVPPSGTTIYAMPLKIVDGSGGPTRVFAEWGHNAAIISCGISHKLLVFTMVVFLLIQSN